MSCSACTANMYYVLLYAAVLAISCSAAPKPYAGVCNGPYTELRVSPVVEDGYMRRLTFAWEELPSGAEIGVFSGDPSTGIKPEFVYSPPSSSGWANTTIEEDHVLYSELGFAPRCLNHYIAYRLDQEAWTGVSCLRTSPTWMDQLKTTIGGTSLRKLYIPGTHDSSAYKEYNMDRPDDPITKYSVTQDEPVLGQLIYGARYIDLRVGYYPRTPELWWGNHGIYQFHPMDEVLGNLTQFLRNTNEIVILDVQEFPVGFGDTDEVHKMFIQYLQDKIGSEFGASSKSFNWDSKLNDLWNAKKRLIIGYDQGDMVSQYELLWPAVQQVWGNVQHAEDLMTYLTGVMQGPPNNAWSAMAQLTPEAGDIILNTMKGLRHAAEAVNHDVTAAFRQTSWASETNVVAMDFLRGSGIVNAAIQWNSGANTCN